MIVAKVAEPIAAATPAVYCGPVLRHPAALV